MVKKKGYQGHKDIGHHNVALWLSNDEALYKMVQHCIKESNYRKVLATRSVIQSLSSDCTPDGYKYTYPRVYAHISSEIDER